MATYRNSSVRGYVIRGVVFGTLALVMSGGCFQTDVSRAIARGQAEDLGASPWKSRKKLFARAEASLSQLPGVVKVSQGVEENWSVFLAVFTDNPAIVPQEFEGVPTKTFPASQWQPSS
jgi:hypothetical protein